MLQTKPKPSQCPRCSQWLLAATVDGCRTAVTAQPLDQPAYIQALAHGRSVYAYNTARLRIRLVTPAQPPLPGETLLAEHPCGKTGLNPVIFEPPPADRPETPCQGLSGCPRAGEALFSLDGGTRDPDGAPTAELVVSCEACDTPPF